MIKIYGMTRTRTARCLWMLEELGLEYEQIGIRPRTEDTEAPAYRTLNPNGRVPTLMDGETVLWESMAINLYLAEKYDGGLKPQTPQAWAHACQWSFWVMMETEAHLLNFLRHRAILPEDEREPAIAETAEESLQKPLGVLEGALAEREFLLGSAFSVADLNVSAVLGWGKMAKLDLGGYPKLKDWLGTCLAREAYRRAYARE